MAEMRAREQGPIRPPWVQVVLRTSWPPDRWIYLLFCAAVFVMPMGTSPRIIFGGCAVFLWTLSGGVSRSRYRYLKEPWFLPVVAIVTLAWLGLAWSADPSGLGLKYAMKTYYWLYAVALAGVRFSPKMAERFLMAFQCGLLANALAAYLQLAGLFPKFAKWGATGYTGFCSGYNTLAVFLVLGMMVAAFCLRRSERRQEKILFGAMLFLYFGHLIILEGRGGYLVFFLLAPLIVHNALRGRRIALMIVVYVLSIGIMFSSPIVRHRIGQVSAELRNHVESVGDVVWGKKHAEGLDRLYMWRWAAELFMEHPVLGVGTGGFRQAVLVAGGAKPFDHPHNNVLHIAASYGVIGLAVFGWFFYTVLKTSWKRREEVSGFFTLSSVLVILVGGLTDTHLLDAGGGFLLAVATGLKSAGRIEEPETSLAPEEEGCGI